MEKIQHFSIRKFSIGAASVLIGISFLGVKASTVKADSLQNTSATELTQSKAANEVIEQDTGFNIKQDAASNIKQEPVSKVDTKQITNDQQNAADLEAKAATSAPKVINLSNNAVATTPKTIDLSDDAVTVTPKETTWHVANEPDHDTYRISNGKYIVELPHISNAQLHVIANDSTKDSVLFTYKGQNTKYVFNIKFVDGHYLLTTYEIKSDKLVKLIDYNFIKSSKVSDTILDWFQFK